jgi:hypothetical protein
VRIRVQSSSLASGLAKFFVFLFSFCFLFPLSHPLQRTRNFSSRSQVFSLQVVLIQEEVLGSWAIRGESVEVGSSVK